MSYTAINGTLAPDGHTGREGAHFTAHSGSFGGPRALLQADRRTGGRLSANPEQAYALSNVPVRPQTQEQESRLADAAAENGLRAQMLALGGRSPLNSAAASIAPSTSPTSSSSASSIQAATVQQSTGNPAATARNAVNTLRDKAIAVIEASAGVDSNQKRAKLDHVNTAAAIIRGSIVNPSNANHQLCVNVIQGASIELASIATTPSPSTVMAIWDDTIADALGVGQPSRFTPGKWGRP